jgi:hypothetical protein
MTYATDFGEVSSADRVWQHPNGGFYLGQADEAGPPVDLSWAVTFKARYQGLRSAIVAESALLLDGSDVGRAAFNSVQNAIVHLDNVATAITNGETGRSAQLLNIMGNIISALSPDRRKPLLDQLEDILRGVPKNLTDAAAFVAEQANQAAQLAIGGTAG